MVQQKIKICILDNCPVVIRGLQAILETSTDMEFAGGQTDTLGLISWLGDVVPHILVTDVTIGETALDELMAIVSGSFGHIRVLVFTSLDSIYKVKAAMRLGTAGYLLKTCKEEEILSALRLVNAGEQYIESGIKESILQKVLLNKKPVTGHPRLTRREKQILQLLASNYSSREISDRLYISKKTVENHRSNMLLKFRVKNAPSLIKKALELDLLD